MRTTLSIDADVLASAKHLAEGKRNSVSEIISTLTRQGFAKARAAREPSHGVQLLPTRTGGTPVTLELVNQLRDEQP